MARWPDNKGFRRKIANLAKSLGPLHSCHGPAELGELDPGACSMSSSTRLSPGLGRVLQDIELRARVELAKLGRIMA